MKVIPEIEEKTMAGFRKCMDIVTKTIPPTKHNSTRLFLGATAGMRLLQ